METQKINPMHTFLFTGERKDREHVYNEVFFDPIIFYYFYIYLHIINKINIYDGSPTYNIILL